jgi:hypothetical protein
VRGPKPKHNWTTGVELESGLQNHAAQQVPEAGLDMMKPEIIETQKP